MFYLLYCMHKQLTIKQKRWAERYLHTGNASQSALEVYDTDNRNTAKLIGYKNRRLRHVQAYLEALLDQAGLSDEKIAQHLKTIVESGVKAQATTNDALKGLELVLKLKDKFPSHKIEAVSQNINIDYSATPEELSQKLREIQVENQRLLFELNRSNT